MDDKIKIEDLELDPDQPVLTFGMGDRDIETLTVKDLIEGKPLPQRKNEND